MVKNNLLCQIVVLQIVVNKLEILVVTIHTNCELLIAGWYRPHNANNNLIDFEFSELIKSICSFNNFLIAGDFNAHHFLWGSDYDCSNGEIIIDNLDFEKVYILNENSPTHLFFKNNQLLLLL